MAENKTTAVAKGNDVGSQVIRRVDELCTYGFVMPKDYNYVNAIKASMLKLQEVKDRNGKPASEVCTPESIQQALFKMVVRGLNVALNQAYFIIRGNKLCLDESYFGKVLQVRRIYPDFDPKPRVIYQGDEFAYETDILTGRKRLVKHEQKLENIDNDFVGAYIYIPCPNREQDLYLMTRKQIFSAWNKSSNKSLSTHKEFTDKMVSKTIINSACNMIINGTPSNDTIAPEDEDMPQPHDVEYQEMTEVDIDALPEASAVKTDTLPESQPEKVEVKAEAKVEEDF